MSKKIGLALGSGSARGLAHIGVLRAFEERGIKPAFIAGTSIGSMMGAAFACGNLDKMESFMRDITLKKMASYCDFIIPRQALMEGDRIMHLLHDLIPANSFEDLDIPFCAVACNIHTGKQVLIDSGDLHHAVRASISLPGIFLPILHEGQWLVDGGLVNPVPVSVVRDFGVDMVIAVDLNEDVLDVNGLKTDRKSKKKLKESKKKQSIIAQGSDKKENWIVSAMGGHFKEMERSFKDVIGRWADDDEKAKPTGPSIFDALAFSIDIMSVQITRRNFESDPADHIIAPEVGHLGLFDYDDASPTIDDGYEKAIKLLDSIDL